MLLGRYRKEYFLVPIFLQILHLIKKNMAYPNVIRVPNYIRVPNVIRYPVSENYTKKLQTSYRHPGDAISAHMTSRRKLRKCPKSMTKKLQTSCRHTGDTSWHRHLMECSFHHMATDVCYRRVVSARLVRTRYTMNIPWTVNTVWTGIQFSPWGETYGPWRSILSQVWWKLVRPTTTMSWQLKQIQP